jgi:hypothetical protein
VEVKEYFNSRMPDDGEKAEKLADVIALPFPSAERLEWRRQSHRRGVAT